MTQKEFESAVDAAVDYIKAGDIFQAVLSQRLQTKYKKDPLQVYKTLKNINPSPYMYYLDFEDRKIAGSSPEMLARVEGRTVMTYPIAGTRSRGRPSGKTNAWRRRCWKTKRRGPNTSCSSTWGGTT